MSAEMSHDDLQALAEIGDMSAVLDRLANVPGMPEHARETAMAGVEMTRCVMKVAFAAESVGIVPDDLLPDNLSVALEPFALLLAMLAAPTNLDGYMAVPAWLVRSARVQFDSAGVPWQRVAEALKGQP